MRRAGGDDGVTVIELMLALVILSLVMGAITSALIVGFKTTGKAEEALSDGRTANLLSFYLARDVQNTAPGHAGGPVGLNAEDCRGPGSSAAVVFYHSQNGSDRVSYSVEDVDGEPAITRRDSTRACTRQVIAPGLASGYQLANGSTLFFYCGDDTDFDGNPPCNGNRDDLKMVKFVLTTQTGYPYELRGNTRR